MAVIACVVVVALIINNYVIIINLIIIILMSSPSYATLLAGRCSISLLNSSISLWALLLTRCSYYWSVLPASSVVDRVYQVCLNENCDK